MNIPSTQAAKLGTRLAEERARLKLTQGELADALGLSRNSVTLYEAGKHLPGAEPLMALDSIGADTGYILTGRRTRPTEDSVDLDRLVVAVKAARRQLGLPPDSEDQREILMRASSIYVTLGDYLSSGLGNK